MSDQRALRSTARHAEGVEKAAHAAQNTYAQCYDAQPWEFVTHAVVTTYLEHVNPVVDSAEGLEELKFEAVIRDRHGDVFENHGLGWYLAGAEGMWAAGDIHLPARVLDWGSE